MMMAFLVGGGAKDGGGFRWPEVARLFTVTGMGGEVAVVRLFTVTAGERRRQLVLEGG